MKQSTAFYLKGKWKTNVWERQGACLVFSIQTLLRFILKKQGIYCLFLISGFKVEIMSPKSAQLIVQTYSKSYIGCQELSLK